MRARSWTSPPRAIRSTVFGVRGRGGLVQDLVLTARRGYRPHGGVRPFHQKINLPHVINFRALCGANLVA